MNCQEFESRIDTLARGALADARTLTEASAHGESCAPCAARLEDERALSTGLRALASGMKDASAPARAETALLAAFRARAVSECTEDSSRADVAAGVVPLVPRPPVHQWSWVRTAAVASLAAAASVALFVLVGPGTTVDTPRAEVKQSAMIEPPPGALGDKTKPQVATANQPVFEENTPGVRDALTDRADRLVRPTPRARATNAAYSAGGGRSTGARPAADAQEIATEFIPIGQYQQPEDGHIVRVELPRSALASFGLPVNAEAGGGRVKADVLLGEDGTARAIRFVR